MAKNTAKSNGKTQGAFVLAFLGSLAYLYVVYDLLAHWSTPVLFGGYGAVFLPIFAGVGVIAAVSLFLASFGLMKGNDMAGKWVWKCTIGGGVTLAALTVGSASGNIWFVIL